MTTELADKILRVIEEHEEALNGEQILNILASEGVTIPKFEGLYDVNEFFELEEEQIIYYDNGWRLRY